MHTRLKLCTWRHDLQQTLPRSQVTLHTVFVRTCSFITAKQIHNHIWDWNCAHDVMICKNLMWNTPEVTLLCTQCLYVVLSQPSKYIYIHNHVHVQDWNCAWDVKICKNLMWNTPEVTLLCTQCLYVNIYIHSSQLDTLPPLFTSGGTERESGNKAGNIVLVLTPVSWWFLPGQPHTQLLGYFTINVQWYNTSTLQSKKGKSPATNK